eukprot:TRINITY_DN36523_c0_g1_i2.p1 TRINITY_DN36523_c0_g1~~TRINITY_DN36523_c0_g1_i2.p1  ORF type:complete len:625 (+),score=105.88 TRINITY_DN36523_c0_g1_i2:45-1919(+)
MAALCRCFYGSDGKPDGFEQNVLRPDFDTVFEAKVDVPAAVEPQDDHGLLSFSTLMDQPLRGAPLLQGNLWYLLAEEKIDPVQFSLFVNGFRFVHKDREISISLVPFSLVRNCKFQETTPSKTGTSLADMKIFKISIFTHNLCYYFGICDGDETEAEAERSRWVLELSRTMQVVTQSLFPAFSICCRPVANVQSTQRRLMAGYLVYHDSPFIASVVYAELHPQAHGQAKLALYENECCKVCIMAIYITERSVCCEKAGINCSCFCVDIHQFAARTFSERKLWLRAISNVKVKLQNRAPKPSDEDLGHYRDAIEEHIVTVRTCLEGRSTTDPLLARYVTRREQCLQEDECSGGFDYPHDAVPEESSPAVSSTAPVAVTPAAVRHGAIFTLSGSASSAETSTTRASSSVEQYVGDIAKEGDGHTPMKEHLEPPVTPEKVRRPPELPDDCGDGPGFSGASNLSASSTLRPPAMDTDCRSTLQRSPEVDSDEVIFQERPSNTASSSLVFMRHQGLSPGQTAGFAPTSTRPPARIASSYPATMSYQDAVQAVSADSPLRRDCKRSRSLLSPAAFGAAGGSPCKVDAAAAAARLAAMDSIAAPHSAADMRTTAAVLEVLLSEQEGKSTSL